MKDEELKGFPTEEQIDFVIDLKRKITLEKGFCTDADIFLAGLKAGRPQWHDLRENPNDLPKVDNKIVLCVCGDGYVDGKRHYTLKLLTRKEFSLFQPVYAWKEIVLPELPKESEIKSDIFPEITLPEGSAELVDKVIADAEKHLKEIE